MVSRKKKEDKVEVSQDKVQTPSGGGLNKMELLEQRADLLEKQLAAEQKRNVEQDNALGGIALEMKKIRQKGKSTANMIQVFEKHDHKNISLWTKWGKRIGPMHPDNAIQTLNRFADVKGILLSADEPTDEQITAYKETEAYKTMIKWEEDRRATKDKTKRSGEMERLTKAISQLAGVPVENKIKSLKDVGN